MATEKRLIDANALSEKIGNMKFEITNNRGGYKYCNEDEKNEWDKLDSFDSLVCDAPIVDAVEVVHARWSPIRNFGGGECYGYCTNCKTPVKGDNATGLVLSNRFCHWCGAKMDGD